MTCYLFFMFVDSLFFATPKSKRVLMGTKVGGEVHGEGQRKRESAGRRAPRVSNLFFGFYAPLAKRFSLPIRRVRGREAQCYTPKLGTVLRALTFHLIKPEKPFGRVLTVALFLFVCVLFWGAQKSLGPRTRTLLGGLRQATLSFFAVATLLIFCFCECPKFCDLARQRRKTFGGVFEVGKDIFLLYFSWLCVFFLVFFLLLRSRDVLNALRGGRRWEPRSTLRPAFMVSKATDAAVWEDLKDIKPPTYDGNPLNLDRFLEKLDDWGMTVTEDMDPAEAEKYVFKRFRYRLPEVLQELYFVATKEGKIKTLNEAKKRLNEQEQVDAPQVAAKRWKAIKLQHDGQEIRLQD